MQSRAQSQVTETSAGAESRRPDDAGAAWEQGKAPAFIITIDTERDNAWARSGITTTENAKHLPRFQELCEKYALKPTFLTTYEMARDPDFARTMRAAEARGAAEVGMHLHAWDCPPLERPLTANDERFHPYLMEFPVAQMRAKVRTMTALLEDTFSHKMTSHRAGRWGFDATYASVLAEEGYLVDCSVTPYVSWRSHGGDPAREGGPDFRFFPQEPYVMDPADISRPGKGSLLQVPMSIVPRLPLSQRLLPAAMLSNRKLHGLAQRLLPNDWLRPSPGNLPAMQRVLRACIGERRSYAMFMTHSSELMPGGSPYFPTKEHIERLYRSLETLFSEVSRHFRGLTLTEFARERVPAASRH